MERCNLVLLAYVNDNNIVRIDRQEYKNNHGNTIVEYVWHSNDSRAKTNRSVSLTYDMAGRMALRTQDYSHNEPQNMKEEIMEDDAYNILQGQYMMLVKVKEWMMLNQSRTTYNNLLSLHNFISEAQKSVKSILNYRMQAS